MRVPWVSWFPSMAITFLGAAVRPSYLNKGLTDKVPPLISGYESRRSPYRETVACPQCPRLSPRGTSFGIDPLKTYRQALTGLSWLSYSRPSISAQYPDPSRSGSRSYERAGSPRRLRLSGLSRVPIPLGGFVADGHAPTLSMTARGNNTPRTCPHRPRLRPGGLNNIG
jgi:hypothetical protein